MKKKRLAIALVASCIALSATLGGCSLVSKNSAADMAQVVATVDIRNSDAFEESGLKNCKDAISPSSIEKRDLVSYFLNVGSQYINDNSNYTYEQVFNMLLDSLIDNAVLVQYSTLYLLNAKTETDGAALQTYSAFKTDREKYEYLLDDDKINIAKYKLYSSLNGVLDSYEETIIDEEKEYAGTDKRTTPTNLDTEQDDYYPKDKEGKLYYYVYTGNDGYLLSDSKGYQDDAIKGTTRSTRIKAYNKYIDNLRSNDLISEDDGDKLNDILSLGFMDDEYVSQLEACVIQTYYDEYEKELEAKLKLTDSEGNYGYIQHVYDDLLNDQINAYDTPAAFESAMGSMSPTSFVLYNPATDEAEAVHDVIDNTDKKAKFGFVYNILLPFNAKQSAKLAELTKIKEANKDDNYYYTERNNLLKNITTEDQRSAWFNGETDYSFNATAADSKYKGDFFGKGKGREYLFFEGNLSDSEKGGRYKPLQAYDGRYSYNGKVFENEDGSYTLIGNELNIDGMLKEFSAYINYVLGNDKNYVKFDKGYNPDSGNASYYNVDSALGFYKDADKKEVDYSKFLYASGKVDFGDFAKSSLMLPKSAQYEAMSAVNELQFAYTTDTGVLSQYVGYSVSAYSTSYIKEFEYAAKLAIARGEGSFTVCAGDYGWHLIYATYTFDYGTDGKVYTPDWEANMDVEGTFENLFYEWLKGQDLADISSSKRSKIISDFSKESGDYITVVKYQSRYQNLLDLDKQ